MQFISITLLLIGIILITISYIKEKINNKEKIIEYRYIPKSYYEDEFNINNIMKSYDDIYMTSNPMNIND